MPDIRPTLRIALASCVLASAGVPAQQAVQQVPDPANLTGEHVAPQALADTLPINHGAPALEQLLVKLRTRASMMLIVAHPDDEDGGFLTYESRGKGARVAMLTLNRGEGGQNLMSADFDDALGLIRTQELLAADRYMGVDQFFGTEVDFGFSKTKEESFAKWTHDRVLYDAVRSVRLYRPLIVASVFVGGVTDGHGQHQVSGEIAQEVFTAAADPKVFPEMGLPPWAPLKVYARTPFARVTAEGMFDYATGKWSPPIFHNYVTGKDIDHAPAGTVTIHEGEPSTLIGMSGDTYIQFARKGLALQKSQNGGGARGPAGGAFDSTYTLMGSRLSGQSTAEQSVFDGVDTSLAGIATLAPTAAATLRTTLEAIDKQAAEAQRLFDPAKPGLAAPPLREALRSLDGLIAATEKSGIDATQKFNVLHELRVKRVQFNDALVLADDLRLSAEIPGKAAASLLTTSESTPVRVTVKNGGTDALQITRLAAAGESMPAGFHGALAAGESHTEDSKIDNKRAAAATRPYFSRPDSEQPFYDVAVPALRNAPSTPPPVVAYAAIDDHGITLEMRAVVPDPSPVRPGYLPQPAVFVPPFSVGIEPTAGIVRLGEATLEVSTVVRPGIPSEEKLWAGVVPALRVPSGSKIASVTRSDKAAESLMDRYSVTPGRLRADEPYHLTAVATYEHHDYTETVRPIGYPGLTFTNFYTPATYKATAVDVTTAPGLKVAYLPGTGDSVPDFLTNLGVTPTIIALSDLTAEKLAKFDTLVLGVRAYAAHAELVGPGSQPITAFANRGGVVIVQYNNGKYGEAEAPFPITTVASSGDHAHDVVDETRPVEVLVADAPLLTWPNKITAADFNNWVDERGHAFAGTWSKEYTALLETHDPDQEPQKGSLLVAPVGKGAYIYCGLALYRELPEGVPGAYRLFANLLSYAKNPRR